MSNCVCKRLVYEMCCPQVREMWGVFWKHGIWVQAYSVKQLTQHFLCIKKKERKRVRPFLCSNMSSLYPVVYKLSTQVGSVFGYPLVQIESWQASWKLLLTLCIINWLKKKSLQYSKTILFSPQEVYLKQFSTCVSQHTKKGQENIPLQLWYFLTVQEN